jgi:tetrahydromethanopterin S-methyltransferase subunit G
MDTHKIVDNIASKKEYEYAKSELIKLATEDINTFMLNCQAKGFRIGIKTGFFLGLMVAIIIFLIAK